MSQILSPSLARCYGKARIARVWKISRASVYRSLKETLPSTIARRPGPVGACSDAELAEHIRQHIAASRLHGEGYRKLWARLRFAGVRTSPRRVRRVMRENGLLAPHRVGRTETKPHDGTIITDKVNEMWGTDMTQTITIREGRANVFVAVEHANSEVVGIHASRSANRFEALEPVRQGVHRCFGAIAPGVARNVSTILRQSAVEFKLGFSAFSATAVRLVRRPAVELGGRVWPDGMPYQGWPSAPTFGG